MWHKARTYQNKRVYLENYEIMDRTKTQQSNKLSAKAIVSDL